MNLIELLKEFWFLIPAIIFYIYKYFEPEKNCPYCGEVLPKMRIPKNKRQTFVGGWTCKKCKHEVHSNFFGKPIKSKK